MRQVNARAPKRELSGWCRDAVRESNDRLCYSLDLVVYARSSGLSWPVRVRVVGEWVTLPDAAARQV